MISRLSDQPRDRTGPIDPWTLLGEWTNYDDASANIARLTLVQRGDEVVLRITGVPDIDWGETVAQPFALTVAGGEAAAFKAGYDDGVYESISREPIIATEKEQLENPRSRSAKVRWARRAI